MATICGSTRRSFSWALLRYGFWSARSTGHNTTKPRSTTRAFRMTGTRAPAGPRNQIDTVATAASSSVLTTATRTSRPVQATGLVTPISGILQGERVAISGATTTNHAAAGTDHGTLRYPSNAAAMARAHHSRLRGRLENQSRSIRVTSPGRYCTRWATRNQRSCPSTTAATSDISVTRTIRSTHPVTTLLAEYAQWRLEAPEPVWHRANAGSRLPR